MITSICPKCGMRYEADVPVRCPCLMLTQDPTAPPGIVWPVYPIEQWPRIRWEQVF